MKLSVGISLICVSGLSLAAVLYGSGGAPQTAFALSASERALAVGAQATASIVLPGPVSGALDGASIEIDSTGRAHAAFEVNLTGQVVYATCAANCASPGGWSSVVVGDNGSLGSRPILQLTSGGQPRLMYVREDTGGSIPRSLIYNACDAGCLDAANWTELPVENVSPQGATVETRLFALDGQGRPRAIISSQSGNLVWFTCDAGCSTNAANWYYLVLSNAIGSQAALTLDSAGNPHVLYKTSDAGASADNDLLAYATCTQPCTNGANWSAGYVFLIGKGYQSRYAIDVDSADRPRIAFYSGNLVTNDPAQANVLIYAGCDADCTNGANWGGAFVGTAARDGWAPDLIVDGNDRAHISYYNDNSGYEVGYAICATNCLTDTNSWTVGHLESPLTYPSTLDSGCSAAFWYVTAPTALALDAAGNPHIVFGARNLQTCGASVLEKLRYVRYYEFAQAGPATPTPTPPPTPSPSQTERVYLPLLRR